MAKRRWRLPFLFLALLLAGCGGSPGTANVALSTAVISVTPGASVAPGATATSTLTVVITPTGVALVPVGATPGTADAGGRWTSAGTLTSARQGHTASLLPDGRVLVVGGTNAVGAAGAALGSAEVYNPSTNSWTSAEAPSVPRRDQTATVLPDGKVVVIGGRTSGSEAPATGSTESFDGTSNRWQSLAPAPTARAGHTATLLQDGTILVVGGATGDQSREQSVATAEIYNPTTNSWSPAGSLTKSRQGHTATLLPDGRVLVTGGESRAADGSSEMLSTAEIYDPSEHTWVATASLGQSRRAHTATLLASGLVLVVGGEASLTRGGEPSAMGALATAALAPVSSAELYDPRAGTWRSVAGLPSERAGHTATLLTDGTLLVVGGDGPGDRPVSSAFVYDPATDRWSATASPAARAGHTATLLTDGTVLITGGRDDGGMVVATAERYIPQSRVVSGVATPVTSAQPSASAAPSASASPSPSVEPSASASASASASPSPSVAPGGGPAPIATATPTRTSTATSAQATTAPAPTATNTPTNAPAATNTATNTPVPTATNTPIPTPTPTATPVPTHTPTNTPVPTNTPTNTPRPTNTPTRIPTPTNTPRPTPTATWTPVPAGALGGVVSFCPNRACDTVNGATVTVNGRSATTSGGGYYSFANLAPGTYTVTANYKGYGASGTVTVTGGKTATLNLNIYCCAVN